MGFSVLPPNPPLTCGSGVRVKHKTSNNNQLKSAEHQENIKQKHRPYMAGYLFIPTAKVT